MFQSTNLSNIEENQILYVSMLKDRAKQFVDRHGWPLQLLSGELEIDEFDDDLTTYCIVEDFGRHRASVRLRPERAGSMVERHFPQLWSEYGNRLLEKVEVTRFCASPGLSPVDRLISVSDLLLGMCRHCQSSRVGAIFGVIFPAVARVTRQLGWAPTIIGQTEHQGETLLLAEWEPSEWNAWNIQECRELREQIWSERRLATDRGVDALVA